MVRGPGERVLSRYGVCLPERRRFCVAVYTTGSMLQPCKELESSLGLFSRTQGLLCGCLMHIQEWQDAPPFPQR